MDTPQPLDPPQPLEARLTSWARIIGYDGSSAGAHTRLERKKTKKTLKPTEAGIEPTPRMWYSYRIEVTSPKFVAPVREQIGVGTSHTQAVVRSLRLDHAVLFLLLVPLLLAIYHFRYH